jgi:hypothetical protein
VVPGNHEYYSSRGIEATESTLQNICDVTGVVLLQRNSWVHPHCNITFCGCTLWSKITNEAMHKIQDIGTVYDDHAQIARMHQRDVNWLTNIIQKTPPESKVVVVTHHAPTEQCIDEFYKKQVVDNSAYFTNLEHLLQPPVIAWVCGHTHAAMHFKMNGIQVILNSIGYKREKISNNHSGPFSLR